MWCTDAAQRSAFSSVTPEARAGRPWEGGKPLRPGPEIDDWEAWELGAPSALAPDEGWPVPRALETREVRSIVQAWGKAAARAHAAGFDLVEIHGAHGFLIHEFLSPQANQRSDEYGGSPQERMRFAIEVAECVRANWPEHKPLFMALAREMLYNPNWAMDAAQKLGLDPEFKTVPPPMAYWLERRRATARDVVPSTFGGRG